MPRGPRRNLRPVADEEVAADLLDVDRHLTDGLAGVEQVRDSGLARDRSHRGGGIDQPAARRHVRERDQLDALADERTQCLDVDLPVPVVGDDLDLDAARRGQVQVRHEVAAVLRLAGDDAIARRERQRVEHRIERAGRVLEQRDLARLAVDQPRGRLVDRVQPFPRRGCGLVPADALLELEVPGHRLDHGAWHQRSTRVVEVRPLGAPRCRLAYLLDVDHPRHP